MTRLHIPRLGTEIMLAEDWTFPLHFEHRNESLRGAAGIRSVFELADDFWHKPLAERREIVTKSQWRMPNGEISLETHDLHRMVHPLTIPRLATLSIDRIYIRKGNAGFDSVTFWLKARHNPVTINARAVRKSVRFWAKLEDVNRIEVWEPTP